MTSCWTGVLPSIQTNLSGFYVLHKTLNLLRELNLQGVQITGAKWYVGEITWIVGVEQEGSRHRFRGC